MVTLCQDCVHRIQWYDARRDNGYIRYTVCAKRGVMLAVKIEEGERPRKRCFDYIGGAR